MERLHILASVTNPGKPRAYSLTNPFVASLRLALTGGGGHNSFGVPANVSGDDIVTIPELDEFARRQWEGVLGYMVGSSIGVDLSNSGVELSPGVQHLLRGGGLVDIKGRRVEITQDGFAFILQEVNAQVWTMLILYLQNAERVRTRPLSAGRCLSTLTNSIKAKHGRMRGPFIPLHPRLSRARHSLQQSQPHPYPMPDAP